MAEGQCPFASQTDFTFQGDTTYHVMGPVSRQGATTVEAGGVIGGHDSPDVELRFVDFSLLGGRGTGPSYRSFRLGGTA